MRRIKKVLVTAALTLAVTALGGCSMFGSVESLKPTLMNGTTAGNIQNLGFAVKQDDDLYLYFTSGDTYEVGDIVKSNPKTGHNSLAMRDGGLYMSIYDGNLYYCKEDGIYRAPMDTFKPERLLEGDVSQLQISEGRMVYIEDDVIKSASADGSAIDFSPIEGAACLNVYESKLFYIDSASGQIWQADTDGSNAEMLFDLNVKQFSILEDVFYYIDSADDNIKRVSDEYREPESVMPYPVSGFNINLYGMFYTREIDGKWVCCNADTNGENEQVIAENGESKRHMVCMFDGGAAILGQEEFGTAAE
jgi:hypothetical protein